MEERIDRRDCATYQIEINSNRLDDLLRLGRRTHIPLIVLLDMAINEFVEKMDWEYDESLESKPEVEENTFQGGDPEDLSDYLEPYQNDPYSDL